MAVTTLDRCDNGECNAQAYVLVHLDTTHLSFCGHHYQEHEKGLTALNARIEDHRDLLLTR